MCCTDVWYHAVAVHIWSKFAALNLRVLLKMFNPSNPFQEKNRNDEKLIARLYYFKRTVGGHSEEIFSSVIFSLSSLIMD